jgi:hypothetical protein
MASTRPSRQSRCARERASSTSRVCECAWCPSGFRPWSEQPGELVLLAMDDVGWTNLVQLTNQRDDMPLGLHDPRAKPGRTEAVLDPSAVGVVHEAAAQRDAVSRAVARDKPGERRWSSPR